MKTKTLLLIVLFSTGISTTGLAQQPTNQEPTLEQTLDWICKFIKQNVGYIYLPSEIGFYHISNPNNYDISYDIDRKSIIMKNSNVEPTRFYIQNEIFLKQCVSIKCEGEYIYIKSDSDSLIKHTEEGKYSNNDTKWGGFIKISLPAEYNAKLEKALKHAAKLCGATFFNEDLF